jgi:Fur family transcriptional regulator, zinc uptake regulator
MPHDDAPHGGGWTGRHDHETCIADALSRAEQICRIRGSRLTALRRRVLELIWSSHRPIGAYAVLSALRDERETAAPPTVYRALDFLIEQGLVHRIQSLNAFVGCREPDHAHNGVFLICGDCGDALEIEDQTLDDAIHGAARVHGFALKRRTVEATGTCPGCANGKGA